MGKRLIILSGLLTLIATYVLTFYAIGGNYTWGYPAIMHLPDMFVFPSSYVMGLPTFMGYVAAILILLFLASGILQLIGAASRGIGIFGSIIALLGSLYFVFILMTGVTVIPYQYGWYFVLFNGGPLVPGAIPYHIGVASTVLPGTMGLGLVVLILGGILGLVGQARRD